MFDNRSLRMLIGIAHPSQFWRKFCTCAILQKRDKYSLKNIGSKKINSSGGGRKSPSYKKYGGSKEFPVTLFQLPKLRSDEFKLQKGSRHKMMIESALHIAIESLIFSGNISHTFSGCPLEITKSMENMENVQFLQKVKENLEKSGNMLKKHLSQVELVPSFSSAAVYWRLTSTNGGPTVEDINKAFDENIDFIRYKIDYETMSSRSISILPGEFTGHCRSMLPAYHTMTNTPLITFHQDLSIERSKQIDEALQSVDKKS